MPGPTVPYSFEVISADGKHKIKVIYPPGSSKAQRRALRKAARREFFRLYGGDRAWRARKRHGGRYRISNIFSRHRQKDLGSVNPTPDNGHIFRLGYRVDYQNGKVFQRLPVTNGGFGQQGRNAMECWDQVNPGPPFRTSGPFKLIQYWVPGAEFKHKVTAGGKKFPTNTENFSLYQGGFQDNGFWIADSFGPYSSASLASFPTLSAYHSRAWDELKPQIPAWNGTQFLYELRDLPGMLKTTAEAFGFRWRIIAENRNTPWSKYFEQPEMGPRHIADQFVNEEFGWAPFISDIRKLISAYENTAAYHRNMVKNNRTWMKRRRVLESSEEVSAVQRFYTSATIPHDGALDWQGFKMCAPFLLDGQLCSGFTDFQKVVKYTVWAAGSFMYYRPEFDPVDPDFDSGIMLLRRMLTQYGLRINPSVLYKITPWSWLADWFTGFGRHIDRLNDFVEDGIVSRNLSVCRSEERTMTKTCFLNFYQNPTSLQFQRRLLLKQRELADSPYGFNVPWNNISLRQWAILGGIGISRTSTGFISRGA
jgi:hypothetical protein